MLKTKPTNNDNLFFKKATSIKGFCCAPQFLPVNQPPETISCDVSLNGAGVKLYKQDESAGHNSSVINHYHHFRLWNKCQSNHWAAAGVLAWVDVERTNSWLIPCHHKPSIPLILSVFVSHSLSLSHELPSSYALSSSSPLPSPTSTLSSLGIFWHICLGHLLACLLPLTSSHLHRRNRSWVGGKGFVVFVQITRKHKYAPLNVGWKRHLKRNVAV